MRRKWKIVPSLAVTGALVLAGTATADDAVVHGRRPRPAAPPIPNQVIMWNRILLGILRTADAPALTAHPTLGLAMMHLAIADAVGAISRRFEPYAATPPVAPYASQAAAAAQAAHDVLVALYPTLTPSLDANLAAALHTVRDGAAKTRGVGVGAQAAQAILTLRWNDRRSVTPSPFVLRAADQFRPGPPPATTSPAGSTRTREHTASAQFWSAPIHDYWNEIAQTASGARGHSTSTDARLFGVLNASLADAVIAARDAAARYASTRGAPLYPSAHSVASFGAAEILSDQFGRRMHFDVASLVRPDMPRHFTSFVAAAGEAGLSRVYGGDQSRFDHLAGARLGRRIGRFALHHALMLRPDGRY